MTHPRFSRAYASLVPNYGADGSSTLRAAVALGSVVVGLGAAIPACAQAAPGVLAAEPLMMYETPMDLRRAEVRRMLTSGADIPVARRERVRMSPEERDALNRELRQAMRGAYEQRRAESR